MISSKKVTFLKIVRFQLGLNPNHYPDELILGRNLEGLGADSLDLVELCMLTEETFDIETTDEFWENNYDLKISDLFNKLDSQYNLPEYAEFALQISSDYYEHVEEDRIRMTSDFGGALENIRDGYRLSRDTESWKGKYIFLVNGSTFAVSRPPLNQFFEEGTLIKYHPHIDVKYPDGSVGVWTPTQEDILSDDWVIEISN